MGLTNWENAPDGKIVKPDVSIAKNYLKQVELEDMGKHSDSWRWLTICPTEESAYLLQIKMYYNSNVRIQDVYFPPLFQPGNQLSLHYYQALHT